MRYKYRVRVKFDVNSLAEAMDFLLKLDKEVGIREFSVDRREIWTAEDEEEERLLPPESISLGGDER
ncbi:MAG: hypothetical protein DRO00_01125 [Thermoproteota archaeon]|nr:MAG: hypothetical protein DRO00_01125 [Candidatus Korarchaeota archaeon]